MHGGWRSPSIKSLLSWRVKHSTQLGSVAIYRLIVLSFDVGGRCVWVSEQGGMVGSQHGSSGGFNSATRVFGCSTTVVVYKKLIADPNGLIRVWKGAEIYIWAKYDISIQRIYGDLSIQVYFPHLCKVKREAHHQLMRIIPMKIWWRLLAESPKIIVKANLLIQVLHFAIVMLEKIVCKDLVNLFRLVIMQLCVKWWLTRIRFINDLYRLEILMLYCRVWKLSKFLLKVRRIMWKPNPYIYIDISWYISTRLAKMFAYDCGLQIRWRSLGYGLAINNTRGLLMSLKPQRCLLLAESNGASW